MGFIYALPHSQSRTLKPAAHTYITPIYLTVIFIAKTILVLILCVNSIKAGRLPRISVVGWKLCWKCAWYSAEKLEKEILENGAEARKNPNMYIFFPASVLNCYNGLSFFWLQLIGGEMWTRTIRSIVEPRCPNHMQPNDSCNQTFSPRPLVLWDGRN